MSRENERSLASKIQALASSVRDLERQHEEDRREIAELKKVNRQITGYTKWLGENGKDQNRARAEDRRKLRLVRELLRDLLNEVLKSSPTTSVGRVSNTSSISLDEDLLKRVHSALDGLENNTEDAPENQDPPSAPVSRDTPLRRKTRPNPPTPVATGSGIPRSARGSDQTPPSPPLSATTRSPRKPSHSKNGSAHTIPASPIIPWRIGVMRKAPMSCDVVLGCGNTDELLQCLHKTGKLSDEVTSTLESFDHDLEPNVQISLLNGLAFVLNPAVFCDAEHLKPEISYLVDWVDSQTHEDMTKYILNPKLPAQPWHTFIARYPQDSMGQFKRLEWFYVGACEWGLDSFMPKIWPRMPEKRKDDLIKKLTNRMDHGAALGSYLRAIETDELCQLSIRLGGLDTHSGISRDFMRKLGGQATR